MMAERNCVCCNRSLVDAKSKSKLCRRCDEHATELAIWFKKKNVEDLKELKESLITAIGKENKACIHISKLAEIIIKEFKKVGL